MEIRAILFDVDGVLVDSERVFNDCWRKAAEREGYSMTFDQALQLRSLDSLLAKDLFRDWYGSESAYNAIRASRKVIMTEQIAIEPLEARKGVLDFLRSVSVLQKKIVIVTSSPQKRITSYLESVGITRGLFDEIITTEQVTRGKPFPDVYTFACKTIGYRPYECVAVEDSPNGVISAHTAGCFTIMFPDLSPFTEDLKPYVDMEIKEMNELFRFIQKADWGTRH